MHRLQFYRKYIFAVTATLFIFWDVGLQVIPAFRNTQQTSISLTLQSLQFSTVIYGARRTHPLPPVLLCTWGWTATSDFFCLSSSLLGEHCTFSVMHNPITPPWPHSLVIRAVWRNICASGSSEPPLAVVGSLAMGGSLLRAFSFSGP